MSHSIVKARTGYVGHIHGIQGHFEASTRLGVLKLMATHLGDQLPPNPLLPRGEDILHQIHPNAPHYKNHPLVYCGHRVSGKVASGDTMYEALDNLIHLLSPHD